MRKFEPEMQILRLRLRMTTREGFEAGGSPPMRKLPGTTAVSHGTVFRPESENATADPSAAPQDDSAKGDDATYFQGSGNGEFSGQILRLRRSRMRPAPLRMTNGGGSNSK